MSKSILLADDSVTIRKVVELTFMDEDYELHAVGSGEEALDRLAEETPDLVIADVHMSGVSGYDVCRRVKEGASAPPVLLLVGTFEPFEPADVEECGADRYLKKPFDSQELLVTVRDLLAGEGAEDDDEAAAEGFSKSETAEREPVTLEETLGVSVAPDVSSAVGAATTEELPEAAVDEVADASPVAVAATPSDDEASEAGSGVSPTELSDETVDRIARRVAELLADGAVRDVAWEVVPDLAEVVIKERLRELESQVE